MDKDLAILMRRSRLTETSLIVHWCTARHGLIKTVAKGALRPKSRFQGQLDLFFEAEIEFVRSRRSDLHTLREVALTRARPGIREGYPRTLAASYFVQLLEMVCERETPVSELFDLLQRALDFLDENDPSPKVVSFFESQLATLLGLEREGSAPVEAIQNLYHRLPSSRDPLLDSLNERPPGRVEKD